MTENELKTFEKELGREFEYKIFDSKMSHSKETESKHFCDYFNKMVMKRSNSLFFIETTKGKKFGCFISNRIKNFDEYIDIIKDIINSNKINIPILVNGINSLSNIIVFSIYFMILYKIGIDKIIDIIVALINI